MHRHPYTYSIINNQYRKYSTLCLTSLKKGRCFWVLIQCQYGTPCPDIHFKCEITHLIVLRKTRRVSVFTWLYKAWLWFLLISRWLDASFTNHSNCAFLSGKVFITSRAKANRAVSSIWGRLHRRHWLAAGTACIIWKTGINTCLMRRRKSMAKRSREHVLCLWGPGLMPEDDSPFIFHILANFVNKENSSYHKTYLKAKPSKLFGPQIFL